MDIKHEIREYFRGKRRKKLLKTYPWWDSSYMMEMISDWCLQSSVKYKERGIHTDHEKVAKKLLVVGEMFKRVGEDQIGDDVWDGFEFDSRIEDGKYEFGAKFDHNEFKRRVEKEKTLKKFYLDRGFALLRKNIESWWD